MHSDSEIQETFSVYAQQLAGYHQMAAGTNRQELGKPLHDSQQQCLPPIHYFFSSELLRGLFTMATISITIPQIITIGAATRRLKSNIE